VEDVANAIVDYLGDPRTDNQTFNLGGNEPKTLLELKDALLEAGQRRGLLPATYEPAVSTGGTFFGVEAEQRVPSLEYIHECLGWRPQTDFAACIDKLVEGKQVLQGETR
jgi:nucleoside-diphosphate-sugar epimerase